MSIEQNTTYGCHQKKRVATWQCANLSRETLLTHRVSPSSAVPIMISCSLRTVVVTGTHWECFRTVVVIGMRWECFQTEPIRAQALHRSFLHCTVMSWRSNSRPWNWHQHQHSAPRTPPQAPYQHQDSQYRHEPPSAQGNKQFTRDIPANFQPDTNHFDTKQQYGLSFPRQITSTAWSQKYHLAGRSLTPYGYMNWLTLAGPTGAFEH